MYITENGLGVESVRLVLKFHDALTENVTVIAYAEFQNVVEIDRNRNVLYEFAV